MMRINIVADSDRRIPRKKIKKLFQLIEDEEEPLESTINIIFIDDFRIQKLNRKFRGRNRPTDVLAFNIDDDIGPENVFGEIYISTDTAAANAARYGAGYYREILRLCCHGYLHLLGYGHREKDEKKVMESKENHYLGLLER